MIYHSKLVENQFTRWTLVFVLLSWLLRTYHSCPLIPIPLSSFSYPAKERSKLLYQQGIVFVNVSSKTSSSSTRKQANDIHMAVAIFCSITLNSTVGDQRHPQLFSSQISPPHQSCLPKQRYMEIIRKKFRCERVLMKAVCSSLKNAYLDFSSKN